MSRKLQKLKGYVVDKVKVDKILKKKKVKDFISAMSNLDDKAENKHRVELATDALEELTTIEACLSWLVTDDEWAKHFGYITARSNSSERDYLFDCAYLSVVLGQPPYEHADEFGLTQQDILSLQGEWRAIGIEPTLVEWKDDGEQSLESNKE